MTIALSESKCAKYHGLTGKGEGKKARTPQEEAEGLHGALNWSEEKRAQTHGPVQVPIIKR